MEHAHPRVSLLADLDDARLEPYRNLRTTNLTRFSRRFIAESKPLVQRLVESTLELESVLVDVRFISEAEQWIPWHVPILALEGESISSLIGFQFHRGYLACGRRPQPKSFEPMSLTDSWTGVMLVGVQDPENLGSILRTCAALGIADIIVGPQCVDPYARRVLRVSMGNAFKLRIFETSDPHATLRSLHEAKTLSVAACLSARSCSLDQFRRTGPTVVLFGNEAHGLPEDLVDSATAGVRIDMDLGTDSLNVSVAAGIMLHYISRIA